MNPLSSLRTVRPDYDDNSIIILDQTLLPGKEEYISLKTAEDIYDAILRLKVRGAPAIGITAAYGISMLMRNSKADCFSDFISEMDSYSRYLSSSRPTAVNLAAALTRMKERLLSEASADSSPEAWKGILEAEAEKIRQEDAEACRKIGEYGLSLLEPGYGLLTHCNAGHLAVSEYGTALAPIYLGEEKGYFFKVFADETRPLLQGARLTAYELDKAGVDVTLICDNMAASVMQKGLVNAVLVGCDRVAANGDTANKIGTCSVAILAKHFGIPFYVLGPVSSIDFGTPDGSGIVIEQRPSEEITEAWFKTRMAPDGIKTYNPAFDVTPAGLITAIVTEKGIIRPPFKENLKKIQTTTD